MPVKIGCAGYPVGQKRYQDKLSVVELRDFAEKPPLARTVERWKAALTKGFEFVIRAPQPILVPVPPRASSRNDRRRVFVADTTGGRRLFDRIYGTAQTLSVKTMYFDLPKGHSPSPDNIGRIHTFFKNVPRGKLSFVWRPPSSWPDSLVERISKSLDISPAFNPLKKIPTFKTSLQYMRVELRPGVELWDKDFNVIKNLSGRANYLIFDTGPDSFRHASAFQDSFGE